MEHNRLIFGEMLKSIIGILKSIIDSGLMRSSMGNDRLSYLGLLHIHYDLPVDLDKVVDNFARRHPRRLEFDSLP